MTLLKNKNEKFFFHVSDLINDYELLRPYIKNIRKHNIPDVIDCIKYVLENQNKTHKHISILDLCEDIMDTDFKVKRSASSLMYRIYKSFNNNKLSPLTSHHMQSILFPIS